MRENEAMAVLVSAHGISYGKREVALREAGSALALLEDPGAYARQLGSGGVSAIRSAMSGAPCMLEGLQGQGVHLIARGEARYPARLMQTARPPHLLFCLGNPDLNDPFQLAVVGTRKASHYGLRHTRSICRDLAREGMCIVSGLALGIDASAHQGALDGQGRTIAVLGGALDKMYPAENRGLVAHIVQSGGSVISEYPPEMAPNRYSFLQRNRIIAGMCLGVLVTEAPERSGAKSTVNHALDEGREVFALPGDIEREGSQLPNRLISEGARLITCAQDILCELVIEPENESSYEERRKRTKRENAEQQKEVTKAQRDAAEAEYPGAAAQLEGTEKAVYDALAAGEMDFDALCEHTGMASDELGAVLMMMELDGWIEALPGCRYMRL